MTTTPAGSEARHAAAHASDEETRYRAVSELDGTEPADLAVLFELLCDQSWRVRIAAVDRIAALPDPAPALPELVTAMRAGATIGARDAAAAALERIGGAAVAPLLVRLDGPDPELRQAAAAVLGGIRDLRAVAPLAAHLADADPNVRSAAAEALGKIGGPDAAEALLAALDSDDPPLLLAALGALGALRVCPPAARVADFLRDRSLRRPAYRLLGASDAPDSLRLLATGLSETSRGVREAVLAGIGMQRARRTAEELRPLAEAARERGGLDPNVPDACAAALGSDEAFVAVGALTVLGWIGAPRHVSAMLRLAEDDRFRPLVEEAFDALPSDRELRGALAEALGEQGPLGRITALAALARLGSPAALESVVREASDPDSYVQSDAIAALGRLGDARAVSPLSGLLGDDAPAVSGVAATALARIGHGSPDDAARVLTALRDRAGASPSAALYRVLGAVGDAVDLVHLRRGLRGASIAHRVAAAGALGSLAHRGIVIGCMQELIAALSDPAWPVRAAAARAFVELARAQRNHSPAKEREAGTGEDEHPLSAEALAGLEARLRDPEPAVRASAAEALGAGGRTELAPAIAGLARDPGAPPLVAVAALHALTALGRLPEDVVVAAAAHPDPEVVKEAVLAAARLPGPEGERLLLEATRSARWDVRRAAARAMAERGDPALRAQAARLAAEDPDPLVARAFADAEKQLSR
jgi:HEAT repeat protein